MEMIYFVDDCEEKLQSFEELDLKSRMAFLEKITEDLQRRITEYSSVKNLLKSCQTDDKVPLDMEAKQIQDLGSKYDLIHFKIEDLNAKLKIEVRKETFYKNLTGFKLVLADSRDWFKQHANSASKTDLEKKIADMESLASDISSTKSLCSNENSGSDDWKELKRDLDQFLESWGDLKRAIIRQVQEQGGFDVANEKANDLKDFMDKVSNFTVVYSEAEQMEQNLLNISKLKDEQAQCKEDFNFVCEKSSLDKKRDLEDLWHKTQRQIVEKILKQTTAIENLRHFDQEYKLVAEKLSNIDDSLRKDVFILGEIKELQQKSKDYETFAGDIKKAEIDIISVKNFADLIVENSEDSFKSILSGKVRGLNENHKKIGLNFQESLKRLKDSIAQTEEILAKINQTEDWLNELEKKTPVHTQEISNPNELFQIKTKFQNLKETCEHRTVGFRELNDFGSELLLKADDQVPTPRTDSKISYLAKKFTKMNARWNEVTSLVYTKTALLEHLSSQYGEFKTLLVSEIGYLDKLDKLLRKSPENAADAEEISEELDVSILKKFFSISISL